MDMEDDPDDGLHGANHDHATQQPHRHSQQSRQPGDNVSSALTSYSKDNPPVHFMSKRARVVTVSRRHAFPPSKLPKGKMDGAGVHSSGGVVGGGMGSAYAAPSSAFATMMAGERPPSNHYGGYSSSWWMSSYEIQNEGILPSGWLEKHARALPSALVIAARLDLSDQTTRGLCIRNAVRAVDDLRLTLAEKRVVPIHLVCLMGGGDVPPDMKLQKLNMVREKICQECYLPQSQVFLIKCPADLEPDDFECRILSSPYLAGNKQQPLAGAGAGGGAAGPSAAITPPPPEKTIVMNPLLRQLDRSLRDTSALYYSRLAEAQERKLHLWRNRYHATNASFEVNTLMAAMRCARYAMKVGTLREFQMRTGAVTIGSGGGGGSNDGAFGGRWTDKSSPAMRHYDEAYRWVMELHRRAIAWRAAAVASEVGGGGGGSAANTFPSPVPITPGGKVYSMDGIASPKFSESPGGGIGVELSLPGSSASSSVPAPPNLSGATPPPPGPPMRRNSPALTSKKGYDNDDNLAFFASLWEQCRAVASIINAKLLRCTNTTHAATNATNKSYPGSAEVQEQWSRHRIVFLSTPQDVPDFIPTRNDDFFGPAWHRYVYVAEELLTLACIAEGRWRRSFSSGNAPPATTPIYHPVGAPWKAYGELSEALLGLRKVVKQQARDGSSNEWPKAPLASPSTSLSSVRHKFVGSILSGGSGIGTMQWRFENEFKRDQRAVALDYILHSLDLLEENMALHNPAISSAETANASENQTQQPIQQPSSSARLHYLAARILMSMDNPTGALVHLKIASEQAKLWPSLHLSIQRAFFACQERCSVKVEEGGPSSARVTGDPSTETKDSSIELLLQADSWRLLSQKEMVDIQSKAWNDDPAAEGSESTGREIIWTHNDASSKLNRPPFDFAVSFLKSTHATSSDKVMACVSIKSSLDFKVCMESIQLLTTSGAYDISNLKRCQAEDSLIRSISKVGTPSPSDSTKNWVSFEPNEVALFLTELTLPSNHLETALGGSSVDVSKFIPKNGKLSNMGLSHAAGNICESRFEGDNSHQQISLNGKPIALSDVPEMSSTFIGGIPLTCHGVVLTLKQADGGGGNSSRSSLKLQIERPCLISPLQRSSPQRLVMEETNYTAHAWSRPAHHPWSLGPRVLRVLGPRPHLHVTNLTKLQTDKALEGTVNRIVLRLKAGDDEDCKDIRVRLKSESSTKTTQSNDAVNDATLEEAKLEDGLHQMPIFVKKSANPKVKIVTENGVALPEGWEPREDVGTKESHSVTTALSSHLGAGKTLNVPLDVFRPLEDSSQSPVRNDSYCSTSYEVIIMYRQVRAAKGSENSGISGDEVMVTHSGSVDWISPVAIEFSQTNGTNKPFPCGIQHPSNMVTPSSPQKSSSLGGSKLIALDGEQIKMRCSLEAKGLGSNIAASISRVTNEIESNEHKKVLYSSDSSLFMNQSKQGTKLSLSYMVCAKGFIESSGGENIRLGVIRVDWKPVSLSLPSDATMDAMATPDEFGSTHGPLNLLNLTPITFYGPECQVLNAPFRAKLLKCPSMPKVGTPFCISYQISNQTAKSQSLIVNMNDGKDGDHNLLCTGKLKEELQMAPFEERIFSFTFMSMVSGKILRPPLTVSSGRHKSWVINEAPLSSRYVFVMP